MIEVFFINQANVNVSFANSWKLWQAAVEKDEGANQSENVDKTLSKYPYNVTNAKPYDATNQQFNVNNAKPTNMTKVNCSIVNGETTKCRSGMETSQCPQIMPQMFKMCSYDPHFTGKNQTYNGSARKKYKKYTSPALLHFLLIVMGLRLYQESCLDLKIFFPWNLNWFQWSVDSPLQWLCHLCWS